MATLHRRTELATAALSRTLDTRLTIEQRTTQHPLITPQQKRKTPRMSSMNPTPPTQTVYTRQQKGHSLILHLLLGGFLLYIPTIYFAVSPNHYYHA